MTTRRLAYFAAILTTTLALAFAGNAAAYTCRDHTIYINGRTIICSTCCFGSQCETTCH